MKLNMHRQMHNHIMTMMMKHDDVMMMMNMMIT